MIHVGTILTKAFNLRLVLSQTRSGSNVPASTNIARMFQLIQITGMLKLFVKIQTMTILPAGGSEDQLHGPLLRFLNLFLLTRNTRTTVNATVVHAQRKLTLDSQV